MSMFTTVQTDAITNNNLVPICMDGLVIFVPQFLGLDAYQRNIADQIISVFENTSTEIQYGYAEIIAGDLEHGITAGRLGFTSATGDMLNFLENDYNVAPLSGYLVELRRLYALFVANNYEISNDPQGSMNVENLGGLIADWQQEGLNPLFQDAQDKYLDRHYYNPAMLEAKSVGLKLPLSLLCFYDCAIQHGKEGLIAIINSVTIPYPHTQAEEILWIKSFNQKRLDVLNSTSYWQDTVYRVHTLDDLLDAEKYFLNISVLTITGRANEVFILSQNP